MNYATMRSYCEENEHNTRHTPATLATPVDLLDMLRRIHGEAITENAVQWSISQASGNLDAILRGEQWEYLLELCRQLVSFGFLEPVLRFALMLNRWDDASRSDTFGAFTCRLDTLTVLGKTLKDICLDAVNGYICFRGEEDEDNKYGREFPLLGQYVGKTLLGIPQYDRETVLGALERKGIDTKDALKRTCWLTAFWDEMMPQQRAELLCRDFLPAMTDRCRKNRISDTEKEICLCVARVILAYCCTLDNVLIHVPMTSAEQELLKDGTLEKDWVLGNTFLTDVATGAHLERFAPLCPGLGQRCMDFLACADTELFRSLEQINREGMDLLTPLMVYSLYAENEPREAALCILKFFPGLSETVQGLPVLQRISAMCFLETEDFLTALQLYRYLCGVYEKYRGHEHVLRRFPAEVMLLLTEHRDALTQKQAKAYMDESAALRKKRHEEGLTTDEILDQLRNSESYKALCQSARFRMSSVAEAEQQVLLNGNPFFRAVNTTHTALLRNLGNRGADVMNYLVGGESVFRHCQEVARDPAICMDFSPALVEMTKALESVLNLLFHRMQIQVDSAVPADQSSYYFRGNRKKSHLEMGNFAYLLYPKFNTQLDLFTHWQLDRYLDISKLDNLTVSTVKDGRTVTLRFGTNRDANRRQLRDMLVNISGNYRNKAAHDGFISQTDCITARELLLSGEFLLWVMMYIIKP